MDRNKDRKLRLEKRVERQIDPRGLSQVHGGRSGTTTSVSSSRYCTTGDDK
jgi:hypothetical protein